MKDEVEQLREDVGVHEYQRTKELPVRVAAVHVADLAEAAAALPARPHASRPVHFKTPSCCRSDEEAQK